MYLYVLFFLRPTFFIYFYKECLLNITGIYEYNKDNIENVIVDIIFIIKIF